MSIYSGVKSLPTSGFNYIDVMILSELEFRVYNDAKNPWFLLSEVCEYFECSATKYKRVITAINGDYIVDPDVIKNAGIVTYTASGSVNTKATFINLDGLLVICASCNNDDARDLYSRITDAKRLDFYELLDELSIERAKGDKDRKELWKLRNELDKKKD